MRGRGGLICPDNVVGTPGQTIKIRRGGPGKSGAGPLGWKATPRKMLSKALADMARAVRAKKR
jgi:hypothetical protein